MIDHLCLALQRGIVPLHVDDHGANVAQHLPERPIDGPARQPGKMYLARHILWMAGANIFFNALVYPTG